MNSIEEASREQKRALAAERKDQRRSRKVPYSVHVGTETFYFGPQAPTENSWEIQGDWIKTDEGAIEITRIEIFPSRRVVGPEGELIDRPAETTPRGGLNRDLLRSLGTDGRIRKAIARELKVAGEDLRRRAEGGRISDPDWLKEEWESSWDRLLDKARRGEGVDWWVKRADQYIEAARQFRTSRGVRVHLAGDCADDCNLYWGVPEYGTRDRIERLREYGLVDESRHLPAPGQNHPKHKDHREERDQE